MTPLQALQPGLDACESILSDSKFYHSLHVLKFEEEFQVANSVENVDFIEMSAKIRSDCMLHKYS